jgi:hypothetical protein
MTLRDTYLKLLNKLEEISEKHDELTDTETREALYDVMNHCFVWGRNLQAPPRTFRMFTPEGDTLVVGVVMQFLEHIKNSSELAAMPVGQARLDFLQQAGLTTKKGERYDLFFGHGDTPLPPDDLPKDLFAEGDYDAYSG